jgi:hypothetical protein
MRGLDPRIHDEIPRCIALRLCSRLSLMDCRVKPGNDHAWVGILCRWYQFRGSGTEPDVIPRPLMRLFPRSAALKAIHVLALS